MPNHITNQIIAPTEALGAIVRTEEGAQPIVDFALIIPEPENIERGPCSGQHDEGVVCWLNWNISNWGTKWNGYSMEIEQLGDGTAKLRFETAWSHPFPVIEALSKKFPDVEIEVSYADEDMGYNLGKYQIKDGARTEFEDLTEGSRDALDFAAQLRYGQTYAELEAEWGSYE